MSGQILIRSCQFMKGLRLLLKFVVLSSVIRYQTEVEHLQVERPAL